MIYEFLPGVFPTPLSAEQTAGYVGNLLDSDELTVLVPTSGHWDLLKQTLAELSRPAGNLFHNIRTAVLLREHGIREIVTADTVFW